jgi:hypothetical protein
VEKADPEGHQKAFANGIGLSSYVHATAYGALLETYEKDNPPACRATRYARHENFELDIRDRFIGIQHQLASISGSCWFPSCC